MGVRYACRGWCATEFGTRPAAPQPFMPDFDSAWLAAQAELTARLERLRNRPFADLERLPRFAGDRLTHDGVPLDFGTYRETLADGRIHIVVQAYMFQRKVLLFFESGTILADGFLASPTGEIQPMAKEDLYDYM